MKRRFRVTVDGQVFEVELEEMGQAAGSAAAQPPAPAPTPRDPAREAADPGRRPVTHGRGGTVKAPLPGTVLDVKVTVGARVAEGQVLVILEAMKMENEIIAPQDGTVEQVAVEKGTAVSEGDTLVVLT
ncbi:MAG: biotin/lipoyl-containing protein [Clostridia bacterium]